MPLYVCRRGTPDRAYRFPDDVADGGTPSGADVTFWSLPTNITSSDAIVVHEGEIIVTDDSGNEVAFFAESTTGDTTPTLTRLIDLVSALTEPSGIAINSDGMWVGDDIGEEVFLLPTSNASETTNADGTVIVTLADADIIKRFDLHSDVDNIQGLTIVGNNLAVADNTNDRIWYVPLSTANDATSTIVREIVLPPSINSPYGIAAGLNGNLFLADLLDRDIYLIPSTKANETTGADGRIIVTLLNSDIIRQHNLPSALGTAYGLAFKSNQATFTLSTDDTDIRAGEPVDIEIASDIGISNFVASDITVTGGTRGALTTNSADDYTLRVTAGSAGTMTVAIAEDAVDPGNAAASEDFTVSARVTATITFDDSEGESGGSTGVNIAFGESVTDLRLSDLSTTAGTLSLVTGSGTSWAATLAFPATGSGTATVSLAEDSTTPQNASSSATIDYAEAAVALALGWTVPTAPVGNTFSATLTSNHPITGVELNDFRFRISDNSEGAVALTAANTTLTAVAGTNNWRLDIVLVGTFDADYTIRLRGNTVQYDGSNYPPAFLFSDAFSIDSGLDTPDDAVLNITLDATSVEQGEVVNALFTYDSAITNFTAADVDVTTGAIKGALTDNSDNTFSMPITAPSTGSGNISVSVAEDVVSPGNNADSASFAYTAPVIIDAVLNITLDATTVENSGIVNATFTFDSAVTGFTAGDVVVTFGATKGTLTNQGNNVYTMPITAPSTGSGTITVRVAVDRVSPGNNADSATFAYTEPTASTAPGAPTSLGATAQTSGTSMALAWTVPSDDGGESITDYDVSSDDGVTWASTGSTFTAYTLTGLDKGTEYTFRVRAVNSVGNGTASTSVTETTATTRPGAPTSLSASVTSTTADLSWTAPTDDGGSPITEYQYRFTTGTTAGGTWTDTNSTATSVTISSLTADTEYTFQVRTVTTVGSSQSNPSVTETTLAAAATVPGAPTSLTPTAQTGGTSMALAWTVPTDTGSTAISDYDVSSDDGATWVSTGSTFTAYTVTGLDKGTEYTFRVRAVNSVGNGTASASVTETTLTTRPSPPTNLTVSVAQTTADLSWTAPTDTGGSPITEYQYRFTTGTTAGGTWTDTNSTTPSFTISSLTADTQYTFQVRAITSVGNSQSNPSVTETTLATAATVPGAPTSLSATAQTGGTSVELDWTAPTNTGGAAISDYDVRYQAGATAGGTWTSLGQTTTSYTQTGLDKGTQYTFQVRAVNSVGDSAASSSDTTTTLTTVPGAPTSLSISTDATSADFSWTAPTDTGGAAISDYDVSSDDGATWNATGSTSTTYTLTGLDSETEYDFRVRAVNSVGDSAASSAVTESTTAASTTTTTGGEIHIADNTGNEIGVIAPDTADGQDAVALRVYDLPTVITTPHAALLDGDGNLHIADTSGDEVAVIATDTADGAVAVALRIYDLPTGITSPRGMVLDGDGNIHVVDTSGDEVAVISPDTADGDRAVAIRTYDLPTGTSIPSGLTIDADGNLHVSDSNDDNIRVYDPNTADGQRAVAIRTYDLPENLGNPEGLTTDGDGNIHVVDISNDNVAVIAPDTADGQRAVALRTYGMPTGITAPQGLAFVPGTETDVENTVPSAPTSLSVTTTRTTAILTWTAPTDDGGTPITEYQYRFIAGSTAGGAWTDTNSTAVTFTISSLDPSTEYTFQVRAVNSVGNSAASSAVTESTLTTVPGAPTGLSATAQTGGTSVELDWTAPTNNGGSTIIDYEVSSDDGGTWNSTGSATTAYTVTGLDKGTEYIFRVRAVNSPHGDGDASASVTETTLTTVPASPTNLTASVTQTTADLSWTAPTDTGGTAITEYQYRFTTGTTAGGTWTDTDSTAVSITISSLTADTEYTFQVRAVNSVGNSAASNAVTETTSAESVTSAIFTITPEVLTIAAGETADIDITSDISVDGLTAADISADAGTLGSLVTNSATSYTIPLTAPATGSGTITLTIQADAVTQSNDETTATVDYAEPQDRVFLFSRTSGRFHSFTFEGTAEATENIDTGETTIQGAAADDTHIYAHNNFTGILRWNIVGARDTAGDFQVNSTTDTYKGLAVTDTHIVLLNFTLRQLEYYDKAAGADYGTYDSTLTVSVGTTGSFTGLCRGGDNLFVGNNQGDVISILTLAGAADSTFTASTTNTQALFVIDNRLHVLDIVGTTDAYDLTGNAETSDDIAFSNGAFLAAFVTFAPTTTTENTVPGAPTSLSGTAAATSMALSWTAPTNTGGAAISDYELRYQAGSTAGGTWTALGQTTTSYTQASLDKGTEYTFQVRAVNSVGNSDASTAVTETTLTTVPGAPTNLTVTPDQTSVDLSWTAPTDTGGTAITEYQYRFTTGSSAGGTWTDTDSTTTSQTITGLDADTEYTFQVRAVNSVGNSAASTAVTETTDAETLITAPGAPTSLSATAETGGTEMALSWTAPSDNGGAAITDYETSSDDGTTWVSTSSTVTTYTVTGLDKGTEYTFQVRAINSAGNGTASASVTETTATTVPGAPTSLDATVTRTTAALSWTAPVDTGGSPITEYQYRFTTGTTAGGTWTDTNSTATSVTISSLTANTEYTFQVRTVTTVGSSQSNPTVTETTSSQSAPSAPQNLSVTAQTGGTSVELDWDAPTDTGGSAVTDYDVSSDNGTTWASTGDTATAYTLTGLDKGTEYNFRVRAVNAQGDGTASTAVTETTLTTVPDAPTSLTVDAGADSADLSWTAPTDDGGSDITGYQYRYQAGTTAGGTWTDTGSATVAFTVSSLDAETEYTFQVRSVNSAGNSAASNAVTATTDAIAETQAQVSTEATYNADLGYNEIPEALGALKKISSTGTVESLGNLWYEERPYNIAATRALSIDGSLHLTMGYGEPDAVLRSDSLASQSDNVQHLVYGKALHYVVPSFESGGSLYDALADIAQRINATLSIDKGIITISDRRPYMALVDGATGTGTGNLDFESETKTFPASGYLIIDYEFIRYTGISSVAFTGVSRGVIGTTIVDHADTADIVYVDAVIRPNLIKGDLGYINDVNRIYNIIRNPSGTVEVRDADSIARYGELPYTLDLGLTDHDRAWQEEVFERYLQDLKDLHRLIDVSVQPGKDTLGLQLGQIIGFRYSSLVYAGRVVAITYGSDAIGLKVRTL